MARSKQTFNKRQQEVKKLQKKQEKETRKLQRTAEKQKGRPLNEMYAYVDEDGNLTNVQPASN